MNSKNYPGSKTASGVLQKIISEIPRCDRFIEAMCGSAVISQTIKSGACIIVNDIYAAAPGLETKRAIKENLHYKDIIDKYDNAGPKTVFYFDPPHLLQTRSYQGKLYEHDWTEKDHKAFLKKVITVKSNCMISHFPCKLYDTALKGWRKLTYQTMTRAGVRQENLYMNFKQPALLLDYRFTGKDSTDRQRIKRKITSLIAKLNNLPNQERSTILSALIDHYNYLDISKLSKAQLRYEQNKLFTNVQKIIAGANNP